MGTSLLPQDVLPLGSRFLGKTPLAALRQMKEALMADPLLSQGLEVQLHPQDLSLDCSSCGLKFTADPYVFYFKRGLFQEAYDLEGLKALVGQEAFTSYGLTVQGQLFALLEEAHPLVQEYKGGGRHGIEAVPTHAPADLNHVPTSTSGMFILVGSGGHLEAKMPGYFTSLEEAVAAIDYLHRFVPHQKHYLKSLVPEAGTYKTEGLFRQEKWDPLADALMPRALRESLRAGLASGRES